MRFFNSFAAFSFLQIVSVCSIGQFYVGFIGYYHDNINILCCANITCESTADCRLQFEVEVGGLNSSLGPVSRRPSESAITPAEAEAFQGDSMTNPLSFQFNKWPGGADVTVHVTRLDGEIETHVDQFNYSVRLYEPSNYYFRKRLTDELSNSSSLVIVFRYECGAREGPLCFTDCADHMANETCPVTPPTATIITPDVITFTGFSDRKCETTDADGKVLHLNCSTGSPTTSASTENETTITSPSTPVTSDLTSSNILNATSPITTTSQYGSTKERQNSTDLTDRSSSENISTLTLHVTNPNDSRDPGRGVTTSTTPSQGVPTLDNNPTAYWPGIVGGVLGGVAVLAASAFICYWNRQKKLQKRQEIYNVNPKILRNFEEFEENGTSGRADVPMETEQY